MSGLLQGSAWPLAPWGPSSWILAHTWLQSCPSLIPWAARWVGPLIWSGTMLLPFRQLFWRGMVGDSDQQQQFLGQWCKSEHQVPEPNQLYQAGCVCPLK